MPVDSPKLAIVMPNIRRFILDHNVRWPNLVNGTGAQDYAKAYGVSDIPANVLIGRDGKVAHLDLTAKNLDYGRRAATWPMRVESQELGVPSVGVVTTGLTAWASDS